MLIGERAANIQTSIALAHKAIEIDLTDSYSWCNLLMYRSIDVLGNAHLTNFFASPQNYEELNNALKAYQQAVQGSRANFHIGNISKIQKPRPLFQPRRSTFIPGKVQRGDQRLLNSSSN